MLNQLSHPGTPMMDIMQQNAPSLPGPGSVDLRALLVLCKQSGMRRLGRAAREAREFLLGLPLEPAQQFLSLSPVVPALKQNAETIHGRSRDRQKQRPPASGSLELQCLEGGVFSLRKISPHFVGTTALTCWAVHALGSRQRICPPADMAAGLCRRFVPSACGGHVFSAGSVLITASLPGLA